MSEKATNKGQGQGPEATDVATITKERDELEAKLAATEKERDDNATMRDKHFAALGVAEKERDKHKGDAEAAKRAQKVAESDRDKLQRDLETSDDVLRQADELLDRWPGEGLIDRLEALLASYDREAIGIALPKAETPEEGGARSFGRETTSDRFVHVERQTFAEDVGFVASAIVKRAEAAVRRALGDGKSLPDGLPPFDEARALTVVVEVA